jgi:hypothetical protein
LVGGGEVRRARGREVEEGGDGRAEDVGVEDAGAEAQAGEGEGEVCWEGGLGTELGGVGKEDGGGVPAMVLLPTPPLAEETAMMWETPLMGRFWGRPRWKRGMLPFWGRPWGRPWGVLVVVSWGLGEMDLQEGFHGEAPAWCGGTDVGCGISW